jgi:hypothetical protein
LIKSKNFEKKIHFQKILYPFEIVQSFVITIYFASLPSMKRKLSTKETSQKKRKLTTKTTKKAPVIEEKEEVHTESLFGEDSDEEQLEIEKEAERDDEEIDLIEQESKAELEDAKKQQEEIHIMSDKALDDTEDIKKIHARINENMRVLANFKELGEEGHSRADYMELLVKDVSIYYGYLPELIEKFLEFFSVPEVRKKYLTHQDD